MAEGGEIRYLPLAESQRVRRTKASTENVLGSVPTMSTNTSTYLANNKKTTERGRFELPDPFGSRVLQTRALNRAMRPLRKIIFPNQM